MTDDDPVLAILRDALSHQTEATERGFADLKAEMAATRKQVLLIAVLGMILQAGMVGVGLTWSGAGTRLSVSPSVTPTATVEATGGPVPGVEPGAPLGFLEGLREAQATTDGTAPLEGPSYRNPEPDPPAPPEAP